MLFTDFEVDYARRRNLKKNVEEAKHPEVV
jgi:hypothetical protein